MSTGATIVFGPADSLSAAAGFGAEENIFVRVDSSTCTSKPSTGSNFDSASS